MRAYLPGVILIAIGVVFLLGNLGLLERFRLRGFSFDETWWPVLMIAIGAGTLAMRGSFRRK